MRKLKKPYKAIMLLPRRDKKIVEIRRITQPQALRRRGGLSLLIIVLWEYGADSAINKNSYDSSPHSIRSELKSCHL